MSKCINIWTLFWWNIADNKSQCVFVYFFAIELLWAKLSNQGSSIMVANIFSMKFLCIYDTSYQASRKKKEGFWKNFYKGFAKIHMVSIGCQSNKTSWKVSLTQFDC